MTWPPTAFPNTCTRNALRVSFMHRCWCTCTILRCWCTCRPRTRHLIWTVPQLIYLGHGFPTPLEPTTNRLFDFGSKTIHPIGGLVLPWISLFLFFSATHLRHISKREQNTQGERDMRVLCLHAESFFFFDAVAFPIIQKVSKHMAVGRISVYIQRKLRIWYGQNAALIWWSGNSQVCPCSVIALSVCTEWHATLGIYMAIDSWLRFYRFPCTSWDLHSW